MSIYLRIKLLLHIGVRMNQTIGSWWIHKQRFDGFNLHSLTYVDYKIKQC